MPTQPAPIDAAPTDAGPGAVVRAGVHHVVVTQVRPVSRLMRRVVLRAPTLTALALNPAQDVGLMLTDATGRPVRRRYTLTSVDPKAETITLDGVLHGHGPGAAWFADASVGTEVDVFGPRGKIALAGAGWSLFVADESGLPAVAELVAALPENARAVVVIEVADAGEEQPLAARAAVDVHWVHRDGRPGGAADLLAAALSGIALPDVPLPADPGHDDPGRADPGHAYLLGESRAVVALRPVLARRGITGADVFVKGYWNATGRLGPGR